MPVPVDISGTKIYNPVMFGYIVADTKSLDPQQQARYKSCYCGLCRAIGGRCGAMCRLSLTYDMVFLTLLLGSLYEPPEEEVNAFCLVHMGRRRSVSSAAMDYAADLNVLLARLSCLDDWTDDRNLLRLGEARLLRRGADAAAERLGAKAEFIRDCIRELGEIEARGEKDPDPGASSFGRLMGELFVWRRDRWEPTLRQAGEHMGRFLYLMDAMEDLERDRRRGLYNPLADIAAQGATREEILDILVNQMASCAALIDRLPLVQDAGLLNNILYNGVWSSLGRKEEDKA